MVYNYVSCNAKLEIFSASRSRGILRQASFKVGTPLGGGEWVGPGQTPPPQEEGRKERKEGKGRKQKPG